jgi:hypothetical protein
MDDKIHELYQLVFKVSKHFLEQMIAYKVEELAEHNEPTYDELAMHAKRVAEVMTVFAAHSNWSGERVALNAKQAALYMEQMALAISDQNQEELDKAADNLKAMDFI